MANRAIERGRSVDEWGPVRRGFAVWLADGRRGSLADIRFDRGGSVDLLVATGFFFPSVVRVPAAEIEAILPGERRIVVGRPRAGYRESRAGALHAEPVRLPIRRGASHDPPGAT